MSERKWHKGPPPHVGWYEASVNQNAGIWRWWNGRYWSAFVYASEDRKEELTRRAGRESLFQVDIEWSDYWPEGARVPRIDPRQS